MITRTILAGCIIAGLASIASPSLAKNFITQKEIATTHKGYLVKAPNGPKFRILSVTPRTGKKSKCKVHIPSIIQEVKHLQARGRGSAGQSASVEIQAKISSDGVPYCIGKGTGCEVSLTIEDTEN